MSLIRDIDNSIEKALALLDLKDLSLRFEPLQNNGNFISSWQCQKIEDSMIAENLKSELKRSGSSNNFEGSKKFSQIICNDLAEGFNYSRRILPALENSMNNTMKMVQKVLDSKGDGFPQSEDIIYSNDLDTSYSSRVSPGRNISHLDQQSVKKRKITKNNKLIKSPKERHHNLKLQVKNKEKNHLKGKLNQPHKKEKNMDELVQVYGGSYRKKESYPDSRSKSGVKRCTFSKECSSKTGTETLSNKNIKVRKCSDDPRPPSKQKHKVLLSSNSNIGQNCKNIKNHYNCDLHCNKPKLIKCIASKDTIYCKENKNLDESNNYLVGNSDLLNTEIAFKSQKYDLISKRAQHYTLPTQSSQLKEANKFLSHNYHHLPFVVGQSTNGSHNLWVNIQEALSLIKRKVPRAMFVQSTNLENENELPLSASSKFTTKTTKKTQESSAIVENISRISTEKGDQTKAWEDPLSIQANKDSQHVRSRCSFVPKQTLSYKEILSDFFTGRTKEVSGSHGDVHKFVHSKFVGNYTETLKSLTQEFECLNKKYEEMLCNHNVNEENVQYIEMLLNKKEEEIKDILSQFNEVKIIPDRNKLQEGTFRSGYYNLKSYRSTPSFRLIETLRRVKKFNEKLKSRPNGAALSEITAY